MKKLFAVALAIVMVLVLCSSAVLADKGDNPSFHKEDGAGESNVALVHFWKFVGWYQVDGEWYYTGADYETLGKMKCNLAGSTFDFVFNGHGLEPNKEYSLVYMTGPWTIKNIPEPPYYVVVWPIITLADGSSNNGGNIHLAGSCNLGDITEGSICLVPVSYTHLTLPTSDLV